MLDFIYFFNIHILEALGLSNIHYNIYEIIIAALTK